ncbi:MAG: hypothetical protein ACPLKS_08275 [Caldisericum exile]|uniref:hypothetical protein n=1 Tax=Caldisericum exile TaxID=693075 RepID=UPI003C784B8C
MENIFSNYVKYLDKQHSELLEQIKQIREQKKQIQQEPFIRETLLKKLYALQSAPEENFKDIVELQKEVEKYRDVTQIQSVLEELNKKEQELFNKFIETPFEVESYEIMPYINYQLPNGCWLEKPLNEKGEPTGEYLYKTDLGRTGTPNFRVICDENGIPIEMNWLIQNEHTYGYPLKFKRKLVVKNPIIEKLKSVTVEKEIPQYIEKKVVVEKPVVELKCSRCGYDLKEPLRMTFCRNCGLSLDKALTENLDKQSKKDNKKKGKWVGGF